MGRLAPVPDRPPRAVLYGRVSAVMGRGEDLISPELQEHVTRDYCQRRGYEPIVWLCDVDMTGRSWSKRQVEHAVQMIEARDADLIIVPRWSRFTRNLRDYVVQTARIEAAGGRLESALEETDPATAAGLLQRDLFAILAQWESRKIGEQWKEAQQRRRRDGLPHTGRPRLGYLYTDRQYVPDPGEAPIVVEMYSRYLDGAGFRPLARWAASVGLRSKANPHTAWSHHGLITAMDSGFAAGLLRVHGDYLPGAHQPIIPTAIWDTYLAGRRHRRREAPRHITPTTALAGLVRCGSCGGSMQVKNFKGRPRHYYVCQAFGCALRASVTRHRAELFVQSWLREHLADSAHLTVRRVAAEAEQLARTVDRSLLLDRLADVEAGIDTVEEMFVTRRYTADRRARLLVKLETQRDELTRQLAVEARDVPVLPDPEDISEMLEAWPAVAPGELNRWLRQFVAEVRATRGPVRGQSSTVQVRPVWQR